MPLASISAALGLLFPGVEIWGVARLSGGASRETFGFQAGDRRFVLQSQRTGDVRDMTVEIQTLRAAHQAGVPVAEVVESSLEETLLGQAFMILSHVEGETIARKILRDPEFAAARKQVVAQCAQALARLHAMPGGVVPALVDVDQLAQQRQIFDAFDDPHPAFELAFHWLEGHRPDRERRCIVHGDFRLGNLMIGPDGLRAVLDWELAHIGDPLEDLGWLCVRAWRFGGRLPVAGLGQYNELIRAYEGACGVRVDPLDLLWWEVFGTLKWGIICMMQGQAHLSAVARSHELAAIGRRVCETEHDLFLALDGRW